MEAARAAAEQLRRQAETDAGRIRSEAQDAAAALLAEARSEAEARRAEAEAAAARVWERAKERYEAATQLSQEVERQRSAVLRIIEEAGKQAPDRASRPGQQPGVEAVRPELRDHEDGGRPWFAPLHSSEITAREFPRSFRGFDPDAVRSWLTLVQRSHVALEEDLDQARERWDQALEVMWRTKAQVTALRTVLLPGEARRVRLEWRDAVEAFARARVPADRSDLGRLFLRDALGHPPLSKKPLGYSRAEVRRLLDTFTMDLSRLQSQIATLRYENEALRTRMLRELMDLGVVSTSGSPSPAEAPGTPG